MRVPPCLVAESSSQQARQCRVMPLQLGACVDTGVYICRCSRALVSLQTMTSMHPFCKTRTQTWKHRCGNEDMRTLCMHLFEQWHQTKPARPPPNTRSRYFCWGIENN